MGRDIVKQQAERNLSIKLTDEEIIEKAKSLGEHLVHKREKEESLKIYSKAIKEDISGISSEIRILSSQINSGCDNKTVECVRCIDFDESKMWYEHDGEVYEERVLTAGELEQYRQRDLSEPEDSQSETEDSEDEETQASSEEETQAAIA